MLLSSIAAQGMGGAPPVSYLPLTLRFPQWGSGLDILPLSSSEEESTEQVKKSPPESSGSGFVIGGDATARVAHLEHSVRFLQEQHRLMLSGLHTEIEALRERNRDLQFQLIFNKESSPKLTQSTPSNEEIATSNEEAANLKREVSRLEREAAAARGEARAAEARALQLQRLVDVQAEKLRELEIRKCENCSVATESTESVESRAELRARLAEAERLVRRLRSDAERQRREVLAAGAGGVTNLLFDSAAASHAHLQCMKNSLHASLRGVDAGFYNNYHFPPVHTPDFWREPLREDFSLVANRGRGGARRPLTLPELSGQQIHRSTVYANNHTRPRAYGYENKNKKPLGTNGESATKSCEESTELHRFKSLCTNDLATDRFNLDPIPTYPELKVVVTKLLPQDMVSNGQTADSSGARARPRRNHHRKHATTDHS